MGGPIEITIDDEFPVACTTASTANGGQVDADSLPLYRIYGVAGGAASNLVANGTIPKLDDDNTVGAYSRTLVCSGATFNVGEPHTVHLTAVVSGITASDMWTFIPRANDPDTLATAVAAVPADVGSLTLTELAATPDASPTLRKGLALVYMALRNDTSQSTTKRTIKNSAGVDIMEGTTSYDGATFQQGKLEDA